MERNSVAPFFFLWKRAGESYKILNVYLYVDSLMLQPKNSLEVPTPNPLLVIMGSQ